MKNILLGTFATGLLLIGSAAQAVTCGTTAGLDTTDVTFRGNASDDCKGYFSDNDDGTNLGFSGTWTQLAKDDIGGTDISNTFFGVKWTLTASAGTSGTWTLSWQSVGTPGLPLQMDLAVVVKASPGFVAYLFLAEQFYVDPASGSGTFSIKFTNPGGQFPDLSHLSVYGRDATTCCEQDVPEPGSLALLGFGLIGLGLSRRRLLSR